MKLTTKGRYAVTAMLDLAINYEEDSVTLRQIAEKQKISLSYLEQLFAKLRKNNLVKGVRGPGGGYTLARNVNEISIAEIISAVDEPMNFTDCNDRADCKDGEQCLSHHLWVQLSDQIEGFLSGIYLGALMKDCISNGAEHNSMKELSQKVSLPSH